LYTQKTDNNTKKTHQQSDIGRLDLDLLEILLHCPPFTVDVQVLHGLSQGLGIDLFRCVVLVASALEVGHGGCGLAVLGVGGDGSGFVCALMDGGWLGLRCHCVDFGGGFPWNSVIFGLAGCNNVAEFLACDVKVNNEVVVVRYLVLLRDIMGRVLH
jgi:hypothetical protein